MRTIAMDRPLLMSPDKNRYIERMDYQSFDLEGDTDIMTTLAVAQIRSIAGDIPANLATHVVAVHRAVKWTCRRA